VRHGFASGGGGAAAQQNFHDEVTPYLGQVTAHVGPGAPLHGIELVDCGPITSRHAIALIARLPTHVAERELRTAAAHLGLAPTECEVREIEGCGRGNVVMLEVERGTQVRELVSEFGAKAVRAELVATRAVQQLQAYVAHDAPVGEHLADQLLLPMAVARAGRFRTGPLSSHATTNIETIGRFVDVPIRVEPSGSGAIVRVG
jgi:RNA 3'-terminal phosphate cyclase (ATP)